MNKLQKRNTTVAAVFIIMTIAIYNWFVTPHAQYLMAEQRYQQTMDSVETKCKILNSELKVKSKKLENLNKSYDQQKQMYFNADQVKDFLSSLQTTAEKNECTIQNIKFLPAREVFTSAIDLTVHQYQANLNILGGYGNIVKFLNTIQNRPQTVHIDSMSIEMNNDNGLLECSLSISIYTLKVKERTENVQRN
jgi:Tfp pilus assembly protein PilO